MPTYFQRPENALKRANEFIDVGKKQRALDALYDVIKSKRHRTWQKIHEPIMEKYLELCVDLKKSHVAKEGLYQYKNICQQVNTKSLEDIVRRYLSLAEEKTEEARKESHQSIVDVDDLDILQTPENLLMSAVSGEDTQDRTDRAILTPWLKFLWESYRQCLDLLRNNALLEKLYQEVAQNAFKFCLKYSRKTEFRKLCDILHTHMEHVLKHQNQQRSINLNNAESQTMHLETRLVLLDSSIQIELWQEAYKAVEDIHRLIVLSKKQPRPSLMANYYQKLGLVLCKCGNYMFHACAWHKLYHLYREQRKNISEHELQKLASRVVCATLAIPLTASRSQAEHILEQDDSVREKQKRLATLLALNSPPTRHSLVKDLVKYGIVQHVYPELLNLYQWLEVEFQPLQLCNKVKTYMEFIEEKEELKQYIPALEEITIMRLIKQVSQVYQTISFSRLAEMAPFANKFRLERVVVDAAKSLDVQVRIDHRTGSLNFGTDLCFSHDSSHEGPQIQSMPSDKFRNQLILMARALDKANVIISPKELQASRDAIRVQILQTYRQTAKKDHMQMLRRRQMIEDRKEELENLTFQREKEEQEIAEEQKRKQMEAEYARLEREAEERERQKRKEEQENIQKKVARERLEQLKSTSAGAKCFSNIDEETLATMDADDILAKQVEHFEKEKREKEEKLKAQEKKIDYLERAKRLEEIPLIEALYESEKVELKKFWDETEAERIAEQQKERDIAIAQRDRLDRIRPDGNEFLATLKNERLSIYKAKLADFEKRLAEERKKRLAERREKRKEERRTKWMNAKLEAEQRRKDEELKRQKEEEERIEREKREQEMAEYREKIKKLEEIEEKKRQREREIEEKRKREKEEAVKSKDRVRDDDAEGPKRVEESWRREGPSRDTRDGPAREKDVRDGQLWVPPKDGGWRTREKAKDESWKKSPREDEGTWRRGGDDEERRGPARDDERKGLARDEDAPRWRDRPAARDDWRREDDRPRREDDRPRREDDRPRREDDRPRREDDRPRREEDQKEERPRWGPPPRGDKEPERRRRDDSPPRRDDLDGPWRRGGPPRDDRSGRDDRGGRDDHGGRDDRGQDSWRKGPSTEDRSWRDGKDRRRDFDSGKDFDQDRDRSGRGAPPRDFRDRDNRGPPRGNDRDWRRDDRGPARDDRAPARDDRAPARDDRAPARDARDERGPPRDDWRSKDSRGPPPSRSRDGEDNEDRGPPARAPTDEDGWQTVRH